MTHYGRCLSLGSYCLYKPLFVISNASEKSFLPDKYGAEDPSLSFGMTIVYVVLRKQIRFLVLFYNYLAVLRQQG